MNIKKITQGKNLTDTEQTVLEYIRMVLGLFLRPLGHGIVIIHHVKSLLLPYIYTLAVPVH